MVAETSVLIVACCDESRDVLRTALEHRGLRILEAARTNDGLALAGLHRPRVIVLDLDAVDDPVRAESDFAAASENAGGTLIVLGLAWQSREISSGEFIAKPYHYKPLVLKIEELLHQRRGRAAA